MASRFEKFSWRARRVLTLAQEEAQRHNHNYIGTEHILLGLIGEEDDPEGHAGSPGNAAKILANLGAPLAKIRPAVESIIVRGEKPVPTPQIGLTPSGKRVIELADDEARNLGHNYVGTEHLLIGLLSERKGVAASVLYNLGITLERARAEAIGIHLPIASNTEEKNVDDTIVFEERLFLSWLRNTNHGDNIFKDSSDAMLLGAFIRERNRFLKEKFPLMTEQYRYDQAANCAESYLRGHFDGHNAAIKEAEAKKTEAGKEQGQEKNSQDNLTNKP